MKCNTKYPILLVHGANCRDFSPIKYWGRIPNELIKNGASIYFGGQDAWGTIEHNAKIIRDVILEIMDSEKCNKINIIAHSKGGLEVRYMIKTFGLENCIASITTISTPHHGSKTIDFFSKLSFFYRIFSFFVNIYCKIIGDINPDFYNASRQLTTYSCSQFNYEFPVSSEIYFQSYAASMNNSFSDFLMTIPHFVVKCIEGENDGLVSVSSAQYANFMGVLHSSSGRGISHSDIVDYRRKDITGFDIIAFYLDLAASLKEKGF